MKRIKYQSKILERIETKKNGEVFLAADFSDLGSKSTINKALYRLEEKKIIKKIMRGIYYKPIYNKLLNEYVEPDPNDVAEAISRVYGWNISPSGDTALNVLGLSDQVPTIWSYVSDGKYKIYNYNNIKIYFKKTTNRNISKVSYKTSLIIESLKALGKNNISKSIIKRIQDYLSIDDKRIILKEAKFSTSWIYDYIKEICKE